MIKLTVLDYLVKNNKLNSESIFKLLEGRKVKICISKIQSSGHNYPSEFIVTRNLQGRLSSGSITTSSILSNIAVNSNGDYLGKGAIYLHEILVPLNTIEDLKLDLEKINSQKSEIEGKIKLLEELGLEEYDDKIIKICSAVNVINPKLTAEEKLKFAQAIAEVM